MAVGADMHSCMLADRVSSLIQVQAPVAYLQNKGLPVNIEQ